MFLFLPVLTRGGDRLNTKIDARGLEVKDLIKDLSDGVSWEEVLVCPAGLLTMDG